MAEKTGLKDAGWDILDEAHVSPEEPASDDGVNLDILGDGCPGKVYMVARMIAIGTGSEVACFDIGGA